MRRLAILGIAALLALAGCGSDNGGDGGTTAAPATTGGASTSGGGAAPTEAVAAGKQVFESAGCASCHTLADAGANGRIGPNLDELKPSEEAVRSMVKSGGGGMPSFDGQLSPEEINQVAVYVSSVAGQG